MRYFLAVAEELHFGRAADRLRISQQPLSRQVKRLEDELGVQLFDRTTRRVELTEAGRAFLVESQRTLKQASLAEEAARRAARGETGRLTVGHSPTALYSVLPTIVREFRKRYPGVEVSLVQMTSAPQEEALATEDIDVGFLYPTGNIDIATETVLRKPLVAVLPEEHSLAVRQRVALKALADEPFILFPRRNSPSLYDQVVGACRQVGFSPKVAEIVTDSQALIGFVAVGLGVGLLLESFRSLRRPQVVYRSLIEPIEPVEFAVAWRRDDSSVVLDAFLRVTREVATTRR